MEKNNRTDAICKRWTSRQSVVRSADNHTVREMLSDIMLKMWTQHLFLQTWTRVTVNTPGWCGRHLVPRWLRGLFGSITSLTTSLLLLLYDAAHLLLRNPKSEFCPHSRAGVCMSGREWCWRKMQRRLWANTDIRRRIKMVTREITYKKYGNAFK